MTDRAAGEGNARLGPGRELSVRLGSALVLAVVALGAAVLGGWAAAVVIAAAAAVVHLEWVGITERAFGPAAAFTAILLVSLALFTTGHGEIAFVATGIAVVIAAVSRGPWGAAGVAYAAIFGFGLLAIRLSGAFGLVAILFVFAIVWASDTGAFFVGRGVGGPKLWPRVSPKKTWSGAVGGVVAGVVAGLVVLAVARLPVTPAAAIFAALLCVAGQAGDLFESGVKRAFGVKDSGRLIPGHGGLMDRVDGLIAAAGLGALIGFIHAGADVGQGLVSW